MTSKDSKTPVEVIVAKLGLAGTIIAALIGLIGVAIAAYFGYLSALAPTKFAQSEKQTFTAIALSATPTTKPTQTPMPTSPSPTMAFTPAATQVEVAFPTLTFTPPPPTATPLPLPIAQSSWDTFDGNCLRSNLWKTESANSGSCLRIRGIEQENGRLKITFQNDNQFPQSQTISEAYDYTNNRISAFEAVVAITDIQAGSVRDFVDLGIGIALADPSLESLSLSLRAEPTSDSGIRFSVIRQIKGRGDEEVFPLQSLQPGQAVYLTILKYGGRIYTYQNGFLLGDSVTYVEPMYTFWIYHRQSPGTLLVGYFDETRLTWGE